MDVREQAPRAQALRVARDGLVQQPDRFRQVFDAAITALVDAPRTLIPVVGLEVGGGRGFDGALFLGRDLRLEPAGDGSGKIKLIVAGFPSPGSPCTVHGSVGA